MPLLGAAWVLAAPALKLNPMVDSILEPAALNFRTGQFGTCLNGQTFQIDALVTFQGWQYATWFDAQRHLAAGRRALPAGRWETFAFDDYTFTHTDVHNVAVIGVCPADGTVHLSFDHHGHPLHYRVSRPRVATAPEEVVWSAALFGPTTSELIAGQAISGVTYPAFFSTPEGKLQLTWRTGGSGNGDTWIAEYAAGAGWTVPGKFISGQGLYGTSATRNAYPNGFDYGPDGRLHTTWVWREGEDNGTYGLRNCHDLMYACSDDGGRTWRNNAGAPFDLPIRVDSPGVTVVPLRYRWGMMNQLTPDRRRPRPGPRRALEQPARRAGAGAGQG
ncbi:MAG: BNR repeat-containing protein [Gammaproteobacteria bacterium]|nr:BNR repeat-containing protein [Gammaproteobacteria bacterium]